MRVWIYMYILKVALSETSSHHHTFKEVGHSHQSWTQKKKGLFKYRVYICLAR